MSRLKKKIRVFLSAAEPSADGHCAGLIAALRAPVSSDANRSCGKENDFGFDFVGIGGNKMAEAGCELLEHTTGRAVMIYNAFSHVVHFYRLIRQIRRYFVKNSVDLVIVCDSPSLNFHIAKAAKKAGIKTLFYVAPQLWAWGSWRIEKLRKNCDKLCCILPFEQDWFGHRGIDTIFVGNPLLDKLPPYLSSPASASLDASRGGRPEDTGAGKHKKYENFVPENARIALMPGSRNAEIDSLWRPMQQIALLLKDKYPALSFITVAVDAERRKILQAAQIPDFECQYSIDSVKQSAKASDFSIVTSGSATLEVAAAGCPMVIMYQSSRLLWHLAGRWIVKTKYLSLINILAGSELVPEFMPYFSSVEPIVDSIISLLEDRDRLEQISGSLIRLVEPLAAKKAHQEVAKIVIEMLS
jgi:lipid-A-disaccharide synthase